MKERTMLWHFWWFSLGVIAAWMLFAWVVLPSVNERHERKQAELAEALMLAETKLWEMEATWAPKDDPSSNPHPTDWPGLQHWWTADGDEIVISSDATSRASFSRVITTSNAAFWLQGNFVLQELKGKR